MSSALSKNVAALAAAALLAGCAQNQQGANTRRGFSPSEYGVPASPRVVAMGEPVPRGGGVYRVGRPYVVRGRTYTPRHDPSHEETGIASWYGDDFHGRRTANGEIYDMYALSAAHPTLPMPSYARVTSLTNGRSVVVRINDRGPFHSNRVIDLSKRAAQVLDMRGLGRVRVTYFGRAPLDGNDDWLVTTVQERGRPVPPQQVAMMAPVPDWARRRPSPSSIVQTALRETLAPIPLERPREQPVQVASLGQGAPVARSAPAPAAAPAPPTAERPLQQTIAAALRTSAPPQVAPPAGAPLALASAAPGAATAPRAPRTGQGAPFVHVGTFRDPGQAFRMREALQRHGTIVVDPVTVSGVTLHQVRIGPLRDQAAAEAALRDAQGQGAASARLNFGS
jgi:rare lipoprotein A